jgi:ADP-heptose:LPS heptosyltransferase
MKRKTIRIISWGGAGDVLLSTPLFKGLKDKYPGCCIKVFCGSGVVKDIYAYNPHIDELRTTSFLQNPREYILYHLKLAKFYSYNYGRLYPSLNCDRNAVEIIGDMFDVRLHDKRVQVFLTEEEDHAAKIILRKYPNPIILHITPVCSKNKEWPLANWVRLTEEFGDYTFIQLGLENEKRVEGVVDLCGKTSFRGAMALVKNSLSFIGIDSSFSHVTNAFDIPGVVLFGASTAGIWGHSNNANLYKKMRCSPCIDLLLDSCCPYDTVCMSNITVEEVKAALIVQLRKVKKPNEPAWPIC